MNRSSPLSPQPTLAGGPPFPPSHPSFRDIIRLILPSAFPSPFALCLQVGVGWDERRSAEDESLLSVIAAANPAGDVLAHLPIPLFVMKIRWIIPSAFSLLPSGGGWLGGAPVSRG
jgi:hypothetical protein